MGEGDLQRLVLGCARTCEGDELRASFGRIERSYRSDRARTRIGSRTDAVAYALGRGLATHRAVERVLAEVARLRPGFQPRSALDLGAGIGSAAWAAVSRFASLRSVLCVDRSPHMLALGSELAGLSGDPVLAAARWDEADAARTVGTFDLVIASYLLTELHGTDEVVRHWLSATAGELVLVDVGSPRGFSVIRAARDVMLGAGATVTAPCPHDEGCPMSGSDWCHFAVRVQRSRAQRAVKEGARGFEDERFAYVVASRQGAAVRDDRIVRRPEPAKGRIVLRLCTPRGLEDLTVAKGEGERYRLARKADWGDAFGAGGRDRGDAARG